MEDHTDVKETNESPNMLDVKIADEVVAVIAGLAATEVEGVHSLNGNLTHEMIARLGMKNLSKGIALDIEAHSVKIRVNLVIRYGYAVASVCTAVQEKVKTAVENMTGFSVPVVNVKVSGVES